MLESERPDEPEPPLIQTKQKKPEVFIKPLTELLNQKSEIDEFDTEDIKFYFKNPGSCISKCSFKSPGSSLISSSSKKIKTPHDTTLRKSDVRCTSAYDKRPAEKHEKQVIVARLPAQHNISNLTNESDSFDYRNNTSRSGMSIKTMSADNGEYNHIEKLNKPHKSNLKRPNTSLAILRNHSGFNEHLKHTPLISEREETQISIKELTPRKNPVADERYTDLINTMTVAYLPKEILPNAVDERVKSLIRSNKALQSFEGMEKDRRSRFEIDSNMKLFEKILSDFQIF